jgi:uncharacterized protein YjcR
MELLEGVKIIAERLENFPDELGKWKSFIEWSLQNASPLEEHERVYLLDAYKKAERKKYNADVLQQLQYQDHNRVHSGFAKAQIHAEGQNIGYGTTI